MKLFIFILISIISVQSLYSQEGEWIDKGNYIEHSINMGVVEKAKFTNDSKSLLTFHSDGWLREWSIETGEVKNIYHHEEPDHEHYHSIDCDFHISKKYFAHIYCNIDYNIIVLIDIANPENNDTLYIDLQEYTYGDAGYVRFYEQDDPKILYSSNSTEIKDGSYDGGELGSWDPVQKKTISHPSGGGHIRITDFENDKFVAFESVSNNYPKGFGDYFSRRGGVLDLTTNESFIFKKYNVENKYVKIRELSGTANFVYYSDYVLYDCFNNTELQTSALFDSQYGSIVIDKNEKYALQNQNGNIVFHSVPELKPIKTVEINSSVDNRIILAPDPEIIALIGSDGSIKILKSESWYDGKNELKVYADKLEIDLGEEINFYAYSEHEGQFKMGFGDGAVKDGAFHTYKYKKPGIYGVQLNQKTESGNLELIKEDYITVTEKIEADFAHSFVKEIVPEQVHFFNKSVGTDLEWQWDFGDGKTSIEENPMHEYDREGEFEVRLTVRSKFSEKTISKSLSLKNSGEMWKNVDMVYKFPNQLSTDFDIYQQNFEFYLRSGTTFYHIDSLGDVKYKLENDKLRKLVADSLGNSFLAFKSVTTLGEGTEDEHKFSTYWFNKFEDGQFYSAGEIEGEFDDKYSFGTAFDSLKLVGINYDNYLHKEFYLDNGPSPYIWNELDEIGKSYRYFTANSKYIVFWNNYSNTFHVLDRELNFKKINIGSKIDNCIINGDKVAVFSGNVMRLYRISTTLVFLKQVKVKSQYTKHTFFTDSTIACLGDYENDLEIINLDGEVVNKADFKFMGLNPVYMNLTHNGYLLLVGKWHFIKYNPKDLYVGVKEEDEEITLGLKISPNPVKNTLYLNYNNKPNTRIEIFDMLANRVAIVPSGAMSFDISGFERGVYMITLYSKGRKISKKISKKIIKI
jgi:PKD domain-containing protein/type IX secretion system substrate protein